MRRSEVSALRWSDVVDATDGDGVLVRVRISATGAFSVSICNIVEHDPVTHGLKRCNTVSAKEAFLLAEDRHYEMLLRADPDGRARTRRADTARPLPPSGRG